MGKIGKRIAIVFAILVVVFFVASFAIDRVMLNQTYERMPADDPSFMPTESYMSEYESTPVEFQLNGQTLRGYIYKADNPKAFIIFRHGIYSQHCDYLALISAMVDRGYTVFAYDALGCGISDGNNVIGMAQSPVDVSAAVNYVRENNLSGNLPLILWGHSWGGYGVAGALDLVPDVDACVSMSGFNEPVGVIMDWAKRIMGPVGATQYPTIWLNNKLDLGVNSDRTALDGINKTEAPVLIVHGTEDAVVGYDTSGIIAQRERITNPGVEYLIFDEKDHNGHNNYFYSDEANSYLEETRTKLAELEELYPNGIPDDVMDEFMANYDQHRGNIANPELIDTIDAFLTKAIGGSNMDVHSSSEYGALREARYSNSGNMLGNLYSVEAKYGEPVEY